MDVTELDAVAAMLTSAAAGQRPALLVLIEVEDAQVVNDICAAAGWPELVDIAVPNETLDGYDVAIAYDPDTFTGVTDQQSYTFENRYATRDLLVAALSLPGKTPLRICASHWPSRTQSDAEVLRIGAAIFCANIINRALKYTKDELFTATGRPQLPSREALTQKWATPVLVTGDLNDNPWDRSVRALVDSTPDPTVTMRAPRIPQGRSTKSVAAYLRLRPRLYNPTWELLEASAGEPKGTYRYDSDWYALDQVLVSSGLLGVSPPRLHLGSLRVHSPRTVRTSDGRDITARAGDGTPITYDADTRNGVSDHFPLVAELEL